MSITRILTAVFGIIVSFIVGCIIIWYLFTADWGLFFSGLWSLFIAGLLLGGIVYSFESLGKFLDKDK